MGQYDKGMMDGWNGDEYEVKYMWEEWDEINCQKADLLNDDLWIEKHND